MTADELWDAFVEASEGVSFTGCIAFREKEQSRIDHLPLFVEDGWLVRFRRASSSLRDKHSTMHLTRFVFNQGRMRSIVTKDAL